MKAVERKIGGRRASWATRFWAVVRYELLWNIRKKKFLGMVIVIFAFAILGLVLPVALSNSTGRSISQNPNYVTSLTPGNLAFFLFALVTVMNSISGEFESGTIVPLLTKPVSRTMVFIGKLFAAFVTILIVYAVFITIMMIGGTVVYGPQNNLYLVPLLLLGTVISTFIWVAIVLAIGSLSKSSLIAALGAFGIFIALVISAPIVSFFSNQAWILNYIPGSGVMGSMGTMSVSTGTDNIGLNLVYYVRDPSADVTVFTGGVFSPEPRSILYIEPLSLVLVRSIAVAFAYILALLFISWYAFKRAQVLE